VVLSLPQNYDPSLKYPLLVYVYGGPGSQTVHQRWSVGWADYLTSNYGIVYASIDGRGTGFQSNEYLFKVTKKI
jgi:dipeptidyl aminopeptidase/acylaminoacyl peptidase